MGNRRIVVGLIFLIFFVISFLTNILGPLVPDIISDFHVSLATAAVLPFCFFIAYGVMSIPAGFLVERLGEKKLMILAFLAGTVGALSFALYPTYRVATISLFVIGAGMAALQVAVNPLLRTAGGASHFAVNSAFAQFVFGAASFVSPLVYTYLVANLGPQSSPRDGLLAMLARVTPPATPWISIYWIFAAATGAMVLFIACLKLPKVERTEEESAGTLTMYAALLRNRVVWLYFLCIFAYVGSEQGTADWMSQFLYRYHGVDPHAGGASAVSHFWGLLTAGCFVGMILLRYFDSRRVLIAFSSGAIVMLTLALFGPAGVSRVAFAGIGLFASIMWPTLVSLALNSVRSHQGPLAGILCTGIMGGAIFPLMIGRIGDLYGLRVGMMLLYLTFGCVLSVGFWAKPIINNAVVGNRGNTDRQQA